MENIQELIPFAKEMLSQRPNRRMLKVYMVGSMFAALGATLSLVEAVCKPFTSAEPLDDDIFFVLSPEHEADKQEILQGVGGEEEDEEGVDGSADPNTDGKPYGPSHLATGA